MKRVTAAVLGVLLTASACSAGSPGAPAPAAPASSGTVPAAPSPTPSSPTTGAACEAVVVAAGDIVNDVTVADQTGRLAAAQDPDEVLVLGDNQYPHGALADYEAKYDRTAWGQLKSITKPVPGNHEYETKDADGYFTYFDNPSDYYAYDAGCGWRGYALNSEIDLGPQLAWLRRDLADHADAPVVASWHQPRFSSGAEHGSNPAVQPLVAALDGRTGVVLNGHEHNYERFAPVSGLRQFVVGTGGTSAYGFGPVVEGSERRIDKTPGVLRLDLQPDGAYRWAFLDRDGEALDTGTA